MPDTRNPFRAKELPRHRHQQFRRWNEIAGGSQARAWTVGELVQRGLFDRPDSDSSTSGPSGHVEPEGQQTRDFTNDSSSLVASIAIIGRIKELSERLFPGPVTIEYASDPEDPSHEYIVFDVVADGGYKEYREREFRWHDEVEKIVPGVLTEFRLCVHPKP